MKRLLSIFSIVSFALVLFVPNVLAQNATSKPPSVEPDEDVAYIRLSAELATVARTTQDPMLMLAAAILEQMAATQEASREKVAGDEDAAEVAEKAESDSLFELAEEYAGTNEELLALIEDSMARAVTMKGRRKGAFVHYDRVYEHDTDVYREVYNAKEFAELCLVGDGDTDLDLFIYDEDGNLVCSDTGWSDRAYCSWTPRWTGQFEIVVENHGRVYNEYRLVGN